MKVNSGDVIATIFTLGIPLLFIISLIILVVFVIKRLNRNERRAQEKLEIERQHTIHLQNQVDELDKRVRVLEDLLKEIE